MQFFWETSNHPGDSTPLQPRFGTLQILTFPKTKITFEREEILDHQWYSEKYNRTADGDWENCVRSQGAYFEGDWGITVLHTMFLVSSSINVSIFHSAWLDTFWTVCPPSSCCYFQTITKKRKCFNKTDESEQKIWPALAGKNKHEDGRQSHTGLWGDEINRWR